MAIEMIPAYAKYIEELHGRLTSLLPRKKEYISTYWTPGISRQQQEYYLRTGKWLYAGVQINPRHVIRKILCDLRVAQARARRLYYWGA